MGHFAVLVVHRLSQSVDDLLAPYSAWVKVPEYEKVCPCRGAEWRFPDEFCELCGGTGMLQSISNPHAHWDWYCVGGRFTGALSGYDPTHDPDNREYAGDTQPVLLLLAGFVPSAVITPAGEWIEEGLVHWLGRYPSGEELEAKQARLRDLLAPYADCLATVVDCHN